MMIAFLLTVSGILLLYLGAEILVRGASSVALAFGVPPVVLGVTVVALATSLPEAVTSFSAQIYGGKGDLALGNVIGSNIANIGLIIGACGLLAPQKVTQAMKNRESWFLLLTTLLLCLFMRSSVISFGGGVALVGFCILFLFSQLVIAVRSSRKLDESVKRSTSRPVLRFSQIILGALALILGGYLLIEGAVEIARIWGISERVIALSIVAIGTSCPELATSLVAAYRKESEIALGNVLGSNILNILFIVGVAAMIRPLEFSSQLSSADAWVMLAFTLVLCYLLQTQKILGRKACGGLLLAYFIYVGRLFFIQ